MTTLLIDADILAYKFAAKAERKYEFGVATDPLEEVTPKVDEWLSALKEQQKADRLIICLSCPTAEGWRKKVLPTYKDNRKDVPKPTLLSDIKDYLEDTYESFRRPGLEADDIMGILSTHPTLIKGKKVIVSEDKDMKTIPGWLLNPEKHTKPFFITEKEADYWHLYQTLVGDSTDGYSGCPGIGPKKAEALLTNSPTPWWSVVNAYVQRGLTEEDALVQARVARICRASDYAFKLKKVLLWTPKELQTQAPCHV